MDGITPVSLAFGEGGLMVTSIKGGKPFVRTLTWKELYKIGLKGKLLDKSGFLKKVSERAEKVFKENQQSAANHKKFMADMKSIRRPRLTQSRPSLPPSPPPPQAAEAPPE